MPPPKTTLSVPYPTHVVSCRLKTKLRRCLAVRIYVGENTDADPDCERLFRGETTLRPVRRDPAELNLSDGNRDMDEDNIGSEGCQEV